MKRIFAFFLLVLFLVPRPVLSSPDIDADLVKITRALTSRINASFPILEIYIVSVQDNQVFVESGTDKKLRKGMELQLFREGKEFTHPITGVSLGRFEESLGIIRISDIKETYAVCDIISLKEGAEVKRGDKARIASSTIKLAILMGDSSLITGFDADAFINNFVYKLEENGRYEAISHGEVLLAMSKFGVGDDNQLDTPNNYKKVGQKLGATAFVMNSLGQLDGSYILTSRLISAASGKLIDKATIEISRITPETKTVTTHKPPIPAPDNSDSGLIKKITPIRKKKDSEFISKVDKSYLGVGKGVRQSQEFDFEIMSFTTGDFDGDGEKEVGIVDGKRLRIYKIKSSELSLVWTEPNETSGCISVDAVDLNHNGSEEIFVTNVIHSRLQSYVIEYQDGNYVRVASSLPFFFRSIRFSTSGSKQLFMQRIGVATPFSGLVNTCIYENGKYIEGKSLNLPEGVAIFGFTTADVDRDGELDVIYVDDYDRLRVYSKEGELKWKSNDRYGGYGLSFVHMTKRVFSSRSSALSKQKANNVKIKGRIFVQDLDNNGVNEIILSQNIPRFSIFPKSPSYSKSRVVDLEWDGISFSESWETKHIEAYLADFDVVDLYGDGRSHLMIGLVLSRGITSIFSGRKSVILFYGL
jgi:hypothetical protein